MEDLSKLTIPKLKALCKERKLTGYSKLNKPALIAKLLENQASVNGNDSSTAAGTSRLSNSVTQGKPTTQEPIPPTASLAVVNTPSVLPVIAPPILAQTHSSQDASRSHFQEPTEKSSEKSSGQSRTHTSRPASATPAPSTVPGTHIQASAVASTPISVAPRPCPPVQVQCSPVTASKRKSNPTKEVSKSKRLKPLGPTTANRNLPIPPVEPRATNSNNTSESILAPYTCAAGLSRPVPVVNAAYSKASKKAFAPLVPKLPPNEVAPSGITAVLPVPLPLSSSSVASDTSFEFLTDDSPTSLRAVTLPPSISQRKKVQRLSMVFSFLSETDLAVLCTLCRLYRYSGTRQTPAVLLMFPKSSDRLVAAHISASHILRRDFAGSRLDSIFSKYSPNMTNYWPYLRKRREEVKTRKQQFSQTFLGVRLAAYPEIISPQLWACDSSRHLLVAAKFLLTAFFYQVSIGLNVPFSSMSIVGVEEVIRGEIWKVAVSSGSTTHFYYVLEATCEVVGLPSLSTQEAAGPTRRNSLVRADWTAYIESKLRADDPTLIILENHLSWPNHEEYDHGISKNWIRRVKGEWETGLVKLAIARRYVLACLVANSLSGRYMSSVDMEQEFNGRSDAGIVHMRKSKQQHNLSLFLPSHHLVERVHITSRKKLPLHPAVATVQTPGREYYILRDNGLQIGSEEEGICDVWMSILRCTADGVGL